MPKRKPQRRRAPKSKRKSEPTFVEFFKLFDEALPEPSVEIVYDRTKGNSKTIEFEGEKDTEQMFNILDSIDYGKFDKLFHKKGRPRGIAIVFETTQSDGSKNYFTKFTEEIHGQTFVESARKGLREFAKSSLEKMYDEYLGGTGTVQDLELLNRLLSDDEDIPVYDDEVEPSDYGAKLDPAKVTSMTFKFFYYEKPTAGWQP